MDDSTSETNELKPGGEILPGMTVCKDCELVIATPNNVIPGKWAREHYGHTIEITLTSPAPVGLTVFGVNHLR